MFFTLGVKCQFTYLFFCFFLFKKIKFWQVLGWLCLCICLFVSAIISLCLHVHYVCAVACSLEINAFLFLCFYTQTLCCVAGELCQYSYTASTDVSAGTVLETQTLQETADCRSLCDTRGAQCQAFVYEITPKNCTLYSQVVGTVAVNASADGYRSLSVKQCTYPTGEWPGCNIM